MSELGISINIEKSEISSGLNSAILLAFGMGMYTVIYIGTMYIYLTRSSTKRRIIPAVITTLFSCNVVLLGLQWYLTKWQFVDNGDTRDSVFLAAFELPNWVYIVLDTSTYAIFALADGLLIWRCFLAWNHLFRMISVPLFLIIIEIALFLVLIVLRALHGGTTTNAALTARINDLASAAYFTSFGTSLVATVLIAYRIYYASKQGASQRRFKHVINILIESGAVYSLSLLVIGITSVFPGASNPLNTRSMAFEDYATALVTIITGMAVTILVARVAMLPTNITFPSTSVHLSGLQFGPHSTHETGTPEGVETRHTVGVDCNLVSDGLQVEEKVQ